MYDYFAASAFLAQQALAQSAPHFLASAFFASLPAVQVEHAAFFSAFLAAQPQPSQAIAVAPAIINAIAATLSTFFIIRSPVFI
jgi:hypothetical protein